MDRRKTTLLLLAALDAIDRDVIGGGGGPPMQGGGHILNATLGQTAIGPSPGDHQLGSGLWYGVHFENHLNLPVISTNTQ